eukprot:1146809-Pelagomonas_calceolata.AAC.5
MHRNPAFVHIKYECRAGGLSASTRKQERRTGMFLFVTMLQLQSLKYWETILPSGRSQGPSSSLSRPKRKEVQP